MEDKKWEILGKEDIFSNKYRNLQHWHMRTPGGHEGKYSIELEPDVVTVFAMTPDGQVLVIREYYLAHDKYVLSLVAGMSEPGQESQIAMEELREEAGYEAKEWIYLGSSLRAKYNTGEVHYYIAKDIYKIGEQMLGPAEDIEVMFMSMEEFKRLLDGGGLHDVIQVACAYRALDYLEKNK